MMEKNGVKGTMLNGVFFTESSAPNARVIRHIHTEISRQNSNLAEIKEELAVQVISLGGNTLMNFKYGQKKHQWYENLLFKWDTESWHGEGDVASLP
jgi:hypothetical protein